MGIGWGGSRHKVRKKLASTKTDTLKRIIWGPSNAHFKFSCTSRLALTQSAPEGALIKQLPGLEANLPSRHYSGYVPVSEGKGKKLFYYFVVLERNPSEDPVVLFLEGGRGCSVMAAFIHQHGPVSFEKVEPRGSMPKLHLNRYSWSKVSNIIYLDSPAGAGYSYSGNKFDY
ncbi:serine carboxypeptidase-like 20 [Apium graveolens]|uniref:serine carboxypeptidase-like 20 n=1 Tax=Apium graveolens TaxID=4045 RepID=UPI003D7A7B2F